MKKLALLLSLLTLGALGLGAWGGEDDQATAASGNDPPRPCGIWEPFPGTGYIALKVAVVEGNLPCRVALRVLKDHYRHPRHWNRDEEDPGRLTRGPWTCHGPEGNIKCKRPHRGSPSGGKLRGQCVTGGPNDFCLRGPFA